MKRIIAEDKPLLMSYDESKFAARLHYDELDVHQAAEMFRLNRELMAALLRKLPAEDFARHGVHSPPVWGSGVVCWLVDGVDGHLAKMGFEPGGGTEEGGLPGLGVNAKAMGGRAADRVEFASPR